jgi:hypothetical protein
VPPSRARGGGARPAYPRNTSARTRLSSTSTNSGRTSSRSTRRKSASRPAWSGWAPSHRSSARARYQVATFRRRRGDRPGGSGLASLGLFSSSRSGG